MTYAQFLRKLKKTPRDWTLDGPIKGHITRKRGTTNVCPLWQVAGVYGTGEAISKLKLDGRTAESIWRAADNQTRTQRRRDLLKACGLAERAK